MQERTTADIIMEHRRATNEFNEKIKELIEIKKKKPFKIIELMAEHKTVSKAELYYSATDEGQKEIELSMTCKGLEKIISSLNTELRMIRGEFWGQN